MNRDALASFEPGFTAAIVGASGGIGSALTDRLARDPNVGRVVAFSRKPLDMTTPGVTAARLDVEDEGSIEAAAAILDDRPPPRLIIIATGLLHDGDRLQPEKHWRDLDAERLDRQFRINTIGPALVAKHMLPRFPKTGKAVFAALSARVGSIADNRLGGWYGYRASKAALNQIIKTLAIELQRKRPDALCIALHPGTVETSLSEPFRNASATRFSPDRAAQHLMAVIDGVQADDNGRVFAWDGEPIPY